MKPRRANKKNGARAQRRKNQKLVNELQQKFATHTEGFASDYLNLTVEGDPEGDKSVELFEKYETEWRNFARTKISGFDHLAKVPEKRMAILDRFNKFVHKFIERQEEANQLEATSKDEFLNTGEVGIEIMRQGLKKIGVITQAKTVAGVQKRVDELTPEKKNELVQVLGAEI